MVGDDSFAGLCRDYFRTVLVVEDDAATREMYRQALAASGHRTIAVADGLGALRFIEGDRLTLSSSI